MASKLCIVMYMIYNIDMIYDEIQTEPTDTEGIYWVAAGIFSGPIVFDILIKDLRLTKGNVNETCR